jgi:hypothetical protein
VDDAHVTATVERERYLLQRLMLHEDAPEQFVGHFLRPPLYPLAFERRFGTLFTAAYRPLERRLTCHWPHCHRTLRLDAFEPGARDVSDPVARPSRLPAH